MLTFFGTPSISLSLFWKTFDFVDLSWDILNQFNWFIHILSLRSIGSVTYFMKTIWLTHQSAHFEKEMNQFSQFCGKNESIQINQLGRVDWYASLSTAHFFREGLRCSLGPFEKVCPGKRRFDLPYLAFQWYMWL